MNAVARIVVAILAVMVPTVQYTSATPSRTGSMANGGGFEDTVAGSAVFASEALVSVGSPPDQTPRNHQNEPAVAIDAHNPDVVVAASIDSIDQQPCPENLATETARCRPEDAGIIPGVVGVYFSFDRGKTWMQPTYTGWTARACAGADLCDGYVGPIGTLPRWHEAGVATDGDPAIAIGPRPVNRRFSWENGSRVYVASLAFNHKDGETVKGHRALGVSRLDNPTPERVQLDSSWHLPVVVQDEASAADYDKEMIWADNAASSPYFGNVYMCSVDLLGGGTGANRPLISVSRDGGDTWSTKQVGPAGYGPGYAGRQGCTVRTDSRGVVYHFNRQKSYAFDRFPNRDVILMQRSFDGGGTWTKERVVDQPFLGFDVDPLSRRMVMDGYAGARVDFATAPSVDIANGAPTGADATDEIVLSHVDAGPDTNHHTARFTYSIDGGRTWSESANVSLPEDRPLYSAAAISPNGDRVYVVYEAVTSPWRGDDMVSPRPYHGVFLTAPLNADGSPGPWATAYQGPFGDIRASYPAHAFREERVGDYVYAAASREYGVGVWIDARNAAVCPAIQDWRGRSVTAGSPIIPAPWPLGDCPPTFGNTDVWSATTG